MLLASTYLRKDLIVTYISCVSVTVIKYYDQKQLKEESVYFSLQFQSIRVHNSEESMA